MNPGSGAADARHPPLVIRATAAWFVVSGVGFGVSTAWALWYLAAYGRLPMTPFGFRALEGQLARLEPAQVAMFAAGLVLLCALDVVAGLLLWQGRRRGGVLGLALSPFAFLLGAGFDLPFLLLSAPIRALVILAWRRSLR